MRKVRPSNAENEADIQTLEKEIRALHWLARRKEQEWDQVSKVDFFNLWLFTAPRNALRLIKLLSREPRPKIFQNTGAGADPRRYATMSSVLCWQCQNRWDLTDLTATYRFALVQLAILSPSKRWRDQGDQPGPASFRYACPLEAGLQDYVSSPDGTLWGCGIETRVSSLWKCNVELKLGFPACGNVT